MNKEEIEHLQVSYYHLHEKYEKLKHENKQLKLNHKQLSDISKMAICNSRLIQENKQLKEKYVNAVSDYETEQYKNNKAIEHIEESLNILDDEVMIESKNMKNYYLLPLLQTLKGEK